MSNAAASTDALIIGVKNEFGTDFIGFTIATALYGITCLQVYLYYKHYSRDSLGLKSLVCAFWVLDTVTTVLVAHSLYTFLVLQLGELDKDLNFPWTFALENELVDIITLMSQCYFVLQLWRLPTSRILCVVMFLLALAGFGISIPVTVHVFSNLTVQALAKKDIYVLGAIEQGLCALCDILITGSLIYWLRGWKSSVKFYGVKATQTTAMLDNLILYAITRGTLTAICQIMFMVLIPSRPHQTLWQPFHQSVGKLYVNSVLASLNFRRSENTGLPAFPLGKYTDPSTTLGEIQIITTREVTSELVFHTTSQTQMESSSRSLHTIDEEAGYVIDGNAKHHAHDDRKIAEP